MNHDEILRKFSTNTASEEEMQAFWLALKNMPTDEVELLMDRYRTMLSEVGEYEQADSSELLKMKQRVATWEKNHHPIPLLNRRPYIRWLSAASIILILGLSIYLWLPSASKNANDQDFTSVETNIAPGRDGAILTLGNGTEMVLDSMGNGIIASQNGIDVNLENGQLTYASGAAENIKLLYNSVRTPNGRQFSVVLQDGTRVWLNSASSIRYPAAFDKNERRVEITGEAYFEVAHQENPPFKILVNNHTEMEVLGTSFNINAYNNEAIINTTLLEGSLKISVNAEDAAPASSQSDGENTVILKPGQQAHISNNAPTSPIKGRYSTNKEGIQIIDKANIEKAMAWKNGTFNFEGAALDEVMRQLERWYNIDVVYEKGIPDIRFGGEMSRNVTLSDLLKVLQASEVRFRMEEGRRLVVLP